MQRIIARINALALGLLVVVWPATAQSVNVQNEAVGVWERAIVAKGGRDRLLRVENLLLSTHQAAIRRAHRTEQLLVFPNRIWLWHDHRPPGTDYVTEMLNPEEKICWQVRAKTEPDSTCPISSEYLFDAAQLAYLLESRWVQPRPVRTWHAELKQGGGNVPLGILLLRPELRQRQVDVVRAVWKSWTVDYYLDVHSHLPLRVLIAVEPPGAGDYRFSDYQAVDGVWMPTHESRGGAWEDVLCRPNVVYDEELFHRKPRLEEGPEAWKTVNSSQSSKKGKR